MGRKKKNNHHRQIRKVEQTLIIQMKKWKSVILEKNIRLEMDFQVCAYLAAGCQKLKWKMKKTLFCYIQKGFSLTKILFLSGLSS